jgi:hypothetical protein
VRGADPGGLQLAVAGAQQSAILERIIVKVNGEILTQTQLEDLQIEAMRDQNKQVENRKALSNEDVRKALDRHHASHPGRGGGQAPDAAAGTRAELQVLRRDVQAEHRQHQETERESIKTDADLETGP